MNARTNRLLPPRILSAFVSALLVATTISTSHAAAPQGSAPADDLRAAATQSFSEGDYESAIEGFKSAHELSAEPTDLYNLGRVHEELGLLSEALTYYQEFVEQPHVALEERRLAADRIEVLRVLVPATPPPPQAEPTPPRAQRTTDDAPQDDNDDGRPLVVAGSILLPLGIVTAAAGGVAFGLRGSSAREEVEGLSQGDNPNRLSLDDAEALHARGRNADALQTTFLVAGSSVAIIGGALLTLGLLRRNKAKKQRRASVSAFVTPAQSSISAKWSF